MECDSKEKERQELAKNIADAKKSEENARLEHAKVVADFQHKISSSKVSCIFCYVFLWRGGYPIYFVLFFLEQKYCLINPLLLTEINNQFMIFFISLNNLYQKKIFLAVSNKLFKTFFFNSI